MPHYTPDNTLVVTYQELVDCGAYKSVEYTKVVVHRHEKRGYGMRKYKRGCRNSEALIVFDSLSSSIKNRLGDPRKGRPVLEGFYKVDGEAVKYYTDYRFADGSSISEGGDGKRDLLGIYIANASILGAAARLKMARITEITKMGHTPKRIWETLCSDVINFRQVYALEYGLESDLPECAKRFKECFISFEEKGYEYLISGKHKNSNSRKVCDETLSVLESLFARQSHKPTYTEVSDTYNAFLGGYVEVISNATGELYDPKGFKPLSKETINSYLRAWQSKLATFTIRGGDRQKLIYQFVPSHKMKRSEYSCSLVSVDDRQPPFEYAKGERAWAYLGIDDGSQCYISWVFGETKEGIIIDFYRQLARNCHEWGLPIPAELEAESSLNSSYQDTLLKPGNMFEYVRIEANNARGKIIERYNGYQRFGNEKKRNGWIARPFARAEANQARPGKTPLLPYGNIIENVLFDIQEWNNSEHPDYAGKTRWEILHERKNPNARPINWRGIIPYIGYKTVSSCNVGQVRLQRGEYLLGDNGEIYLGERLINLMKMVEGEEVNVYWLDDNDGNVLKAYAYIGGTYICELLAKPVYHRAKIEQTNEDLAARELMSSYVSTIEAYRKRRVMDVERITVLDNRIKTLNNGFRIRGIQNTIIAPNTNFEEKEVEVLEEVETSFNVDLNAIKTSFSRPPLVERF